MKSTTECLASGVLATLMGAVIIGLVGCGGGGGTGGTGGTSTGLGGGSGSVLTTAQRQVVMTAVSTALSKLTRNASGLWDPNGIVSALKSISGVSNPTAQTDGSVTAQFSDGRPFSVFNDKYLPTRSAYKSAVTAVTRTVPAGNGVAFQNALDYAGNGYDNLNVSKAATVLDANGYNAPASDGLAALVQLRNLGQNKLGILYLGGHGGQASDFTNSTSHSWSLMTSSPWPSNATDDADYANGYIFPAASPDGGVYWCITPGFVTHYNWQFDNDSFVILDACFGGCTDLTVDAASFRDALSVSGASVVVGWPGNENVGGSATLSLIDDMLGIDPTSTSGQPLPRPLSLQDALAEVGSTAPTPFPFPKSSGEQFTALLPLIASATIGSPLDPNTKTLTLTLNGEFGVPGATPTDTKVFVGGDPANGATGTQATNVAVTATGLTCTLPASVPGTSNTTAAVTGPQNIIATVTTAPNRTLQSNIINMTIVVGRWDAIWTSGDPSGDIGMLITSQNYSTSAGSPAGGSSNVIQTASGTTVGNKIDGTITGSDLAFSISGAPRNHLTANVSLNAGSSVMDGTVSGIPSTGVGTFSIGAHFTLTSTVPTTPYTGPPTVVSSALIRLPSLGEYAVSVTWSRPMGGSWEYDTMQDGNSITEGDNGVDIPNQTYNPATYTFTMPILASAGLMSSSALDSNGTPYGPCSFSIGGANSWRDSYGAPNSQGYTSSFIVS